MKRLTALFIGLLLIAGVLVIGSATAAESTLDLKEQNRNQNRNSNRSSNDDDDSNRNANNNGNSGHRRQRGKHGRRNRHSDDD